MPRLPQTSSTAISTASPTVATPALPVILEYQSPSTAIVNAPIPPMARGISWMIGSMVIACFAAMTIIQVDRVVTAQGKIIAKAATIVVQPLDTAIVRSIEVQECKQVHAGQIFFARLDPTPRGGRSRVAQESGRRVFGAGGAHAGGDRKPAFTYAGTDLHLGARGGDLRATAVQSTTTSSRVTGRRPTACPHRWRRPIRMSSVTKDRLSVAMNLEKMRMELDKLGVGSKINTLSAQDTRAEMQRNLDSVEQAGFGAQRDLAALIAERDGYIQSWHADIAEKLAEAASKLSDARESFNKAQLKRQLVELARRSGMPRS